MLNDSRARALGDRFRAARFARFRRMLQAVLAEQPACSILDVGGLATYWQAVAPELLADPRVGITLVNLDYAPDAADSAGLARRVGDARVLDGFGAGEFDIVHSNSVIEHVGRWEDMVSMAQAVRRVGRRWWVQTPNWWFPVEPHNRTPAFHWLPEQLRYRLLLHFHLGHWPRADGVDGAMRLVQSACLLDRRQMQALFPESTIFSEKLLGFSKSLIAVGGDGLPRDPHSGRRRLRV